MISCLVTRWFRKEDADLVQCMRGFLDSMPASSLQSVSVSKGTVYMFHNDEDANFFLLKYGKYAKLIEDDSDYQTNEYGDFY